MVNELRMPINQDQAPPAYSPLVQRRNSPEHKQKQQGSQVYRVPIQVAGRNGQWEKAESLPPQQRTPVYRAQTSHPGSHHDSGSDERENDQATVAPQQENETPNPQQLPRHPIHPNGNNHTSSQVDHPQPGSQTTSQSSTQSSDNEEDDASVDENQPPQLRLIDKIMDSSEQLGHQVECFRGKKGDKEYLMLEEFLTRNLLQLDNVETGGQDEIRQARKSAIAMTSGYLDKLEMKIASVYWWL